MLSGLLLGKLPEEIICDGKPYPVNTDFRAWIQIETVLFEEAGDFAAKLPRLLKLCYRQLPNRLGAAVDGMAAFYAGQVPEARTGNVRRNKPVYSFAQDAALIYAGFYQQYGIDLTTAGLHWFQFKALLSGLGEDTRFVKVTHYRAVDLSSLQNKEQRRFYRKMKDLYKLKDYKSPKEREAELAATLEGLF